MSAAVPFVALPTAVITGVSPFKSPIAPERLTSFGISSFVVTFKSLAVGATSILLITKL